MAEETTAVIDLGDLPPGSATDPMDHRQRWPRHWSRRAAAMIAMLMLSTVTASASSPSMATSVLLGGGAVKATALSVTDDRLFITSGEPSADSDWTLSAYTLPAGRHLWTTPRNTAGGQVFRIQPVGDVVLVFADASDGGTSALDAATGEQRWSVPEIVAPVDEHIGLVTAAPTRGLAGSDGSDPGAPASAYALDLVTGARLWSVIAPAGSSLRPLPPAPDRARAILIRTDGRVELRDAETGAIRRERALSIDIGMPVALTAQGNFLLFWHWHDSEDRASVTAIARDTLAQHWSRPIRLGNMGALWCGTLVCLNDIGVEAIDPTTGSTRWRLPNRHFVLAFGEQILAFDGPENLPTPYGVIDPATGRTSVDLRGWSFSRLSTISSADRPALHRIRAKQPMLFGSPDPSLGIVRILSDQVEPGSACLAGPESVVCRNLSGQVEIWTH